MKLSQQATNWLRENKERVESGSKSAKRQAVERGKAVRHHLNRASQARDLKSKYLAHPSAQYLMTFEQFRDVGKRDAICREYGIELIRL